MTYQDSTRQAQELARDLRKIVSRNPARVEVYTLAAELAEDGFAENMARVVIRTRCGQAGNYTHSYDAIQVYVEKDNAGEVIGVGYTYLLGLSIPAGNFADEKKHYKTIKGVVNRAKQYL